MLRRMWSGLWRPPANAFSGPGQMAVGAIMLAVTLIFRGEGFWAMLAMSLFWLLAGVSDLELARWSSWRGWLRGAALCCAFAAALVWFRLGLS